MGKPVPDSISASQPAAFFDRDGVLNENHGYVYDATQFDLVDGATDAVRLCNEAGYRVFVVTNQAGVARGYYGEEAIAPLHRHMVTTFAEFGARIDDIRYCPHHPDGVVPDYARACSWRKPGAGMIHDLAATWGVDLSRSFLIGDSPTDVEAAAAAGVRGYRFAGGDLSVLVRRALADADADAGTGVGQGEP